MNKKVVIVIVAVVLLLGIGLIFIGVSSISGRATSEISLPEKATFEGRITNAKVEPGIIEGVSAYDRNCIGTHMWTECDGGIKTKEYGILNFHYAHNMMENPCIHMNGPEKLIVEILNSNGEAKVYRV